jgi:hypothetical protein
MSSRSIWALPLALLGMAAPALASELPGIDYPYATYRQRLQAYGWRADPSAPSCGPYPETCTGNRTGSARWIHPIGSRRVEILLWPCKHGWCVAPAFNESEAR